MLVQLPRPKEAAILVAAMDSAMAAAMAADPTAPAAAPTTAVAAGPFAPATGGNADAAERRRRKRPMVENQAGSSAADVNLGAGASTDRARAPASRGTTHISAGKRVTRSSSIRSKLAPGFYTMAELKERVDREQIHFLAIDPGVNKLMLVNDTDTGENYRGVISYTQKQRAHEKGTHLQRKRMEMEKKKDNDGAVLAAEQAMSEHSKRATNPGLYLRYSNERLRQMGHLLPFYGLRRYRVRRRHRSIKEAKSFAAFANSIKNTYQTDDRQLVLGVGAWGMVAGTSWPNKGHPPAYGVGLTRRLSKLFPVVWVGEANTSKRCSHCRMSYPELKAECTAWKEKVKAEDSDRIHELLKCSVCGRVFDRDVNASVNIGINLIAEFDNNTAQLETMKLPEKDDIAYDMRDLEVDLTLHVSDDDHDLDSD